MSKVIEPSQLKVKEELRRRGGPRPSLAALPSARGPRLLSGLTFIIAQNATDQLTLTSV